MSVARIAVGAESRYDVLVGDERVGVLGELPGLVRRAAPGARTAVVVGAKGREGMSGPACDVLGEAGYQVRQLSVPDGEAAKDVEVAARLWSALAEHRVSRSDIMVAVGGGAVTDLAGFVAATWLRGIPVILMPTTLLAIVDAAIGGKTAINIAEGKNLVGAFHQPAGVLCDLSALATLPARQYASGLAEVIKAGFIADPVILDLIEADPAAAARPGGARERELVERAIAVKADVVSADPREAGRREVLNYGHTLGHAIEQAEAYRIPHGEAVSVGMAFAAAVARLSGRLDEPTAARHARVCAAVGLPVRYHGSWGRLREAMAVDKKVRGARLRLVVLEGLARPATLPDPPEMLLEQAWSEVSGAS